MKKALNLVLLSGCLVMTGCGSNSSNNNTYETYKEVVQETISEDASTKVLTKELVGMNDDGSYLVQVEVKVGEQEDIYQMYCRIDGNGAILDIYEDIEKMTCFTNGQSIAAVKTVNSDSNSQDEVTLYGIMNPSGEWIVEPKYTSMEYLNKNFYKVAIEKFDDFGSLGYAYSVINNKGELVLEMIEDEKLLLNETTDFIYYYDQLYTYTGETIVPDLDLSKTYYDGTYRDGYCVLKDMDTDTEYYVSADGTSTVNENLEQEYTNPSKNTYWKWDYDLEGYFYYVNGVETAIKEAVAPVVPDAHNRIIFQNNKEEYGIALADGTLVTQKMYKEIKPFNRQGYALARELREDHSGGYWVVLDINGNEVITKEAKIVEAELYLPSVGIRDEEGNEHYKLLNLYTLDLVDEEQLMVNFVRTIERQYKK